MFIQNLEGLNQFYIQLAETHNKTKTVSIKSAHVFEPLYLKNS